jgi:hypothetical protein
MSRIAPEVWTCLEANRPVGEALTVRPAAPGVTSRLQAGIDVEGTRHLLIQLSAGEAELRDSESRGLIVQTRELVLSAQAPAHGTITMSAKGVDAQASRNSKE